MKALSLGVCCSSLLAALVTFVAGNAAASERVAIVVGANEAPQGRRPLGFAHDDARMFSRVLTRVGEFAPDQVLTLLEPTPDQVLTSLDAQIARLADSPESLLLFYYSGHSDYDALYPSGEALPFEQLKQRLEDPRITVRLGIIDSCRGGGWTGAKGLEAAAPFALPSLSALGNSGTILIASSSGLEDAHESEQLRGSFFTHHLSAGLLGAADRNQDAHVSVVEAFDYAKGLTIRDTALAARAPQHPSFHMKLQGRQDLRLANLESGQSWMSLDQKAGPLEVVHLATGLVLIELQAGERALRLAVAPGRYLVRRRQGKEIHAKEYDVTAGEVTRVAEDELELSGLDRLVAKGAPAKLWQLNYYVFGGSGLHRGMGQAFSEAAMGRWAPSDTPLLGYLGFGISNSGVGLEVSVPGRIAERLGSPESIEWVPWLSLPYYFVPDAEGKDAFWAPFGAGLDTWVRLGGRARLGFNLGTTLLPQESSAARAWGAIGGSLRAGDRWFFNLGLGYAENVWSSAEGAIGSPLADVADARIALGSVMTDGIHPRPLAQYSFSDQFALGVSAQIDQPLAGGRMGYEVTLGWTWRLGQVNLLVR